MSSETLDAEQNRMNLSPKPFVFVLMPLKPEFDDVYEAGIKPACERAGAYAERVDEQIFQGSILQRIYNQIAKADLIIADMSGRNPNVFYETGYAHALGKRVVLLTQAADDIPFDLKHFLHIVYNNRIVDLLPELERWVRFLLETPAEAAKRRVRLLVNDIDVMERPTVPIVVPPKHIGFSLKLDVNNPVDRGPHALTCEVGLLTGLEIVSVHLDEPDAKIQTFAVDPNHRLYLVLAPIYVLPGSWGRVRLSPRTDNRALENSETFRFGLRVFTDSGYEDHEFGISVEVPPGHGERP